MASEQNSNETNKWDALIRLIEFAEDDTLGFLAVLCAVFVVIVLFVFRVPSRRLWKDFEEKMKGIVTELLENLPSSDDSNTDEDSDD